MKSLGRIKVVDLKLTDTCNLNCVMCGQRKRTEGVNSKNFIDYVDIVSFFQNVPKELLIFFWGGEPLVHPNLREILSFFSKKGASLAINTNGYLLEDYIDFFQDVPISSLVVSIDGIGDLHDSIRGCSGLFNKVETSLRKYIKRVRGKTPERKVIINFTIIPENYLIMEEFCDLVKSWDIDTVTFNFPIIVDEKLGSLFSKRFFETYGVEMNSWKGYKNYYNMRFDYNKLSNICINLINKHGYFVRWSHDNFIINEKNLYTYYERPDLNIGNLKNNQCNKILDALVVNSNVDIVICPDFPDTVLGNIRKDVFLDFDNMCLYHKYGLINSYGATCYRCSHRYRVSPYRYSKKCQKSCK